MLEGEVLYDGACILVIWVFSSMLGEKLCPVADALGTADVEGVRRDGRAAAPWCPPWPGCRDEPGSFRDLPGASCSSLGHLVPVALVHDSAAG